MKNIMENLYEAKAKLLEIKAEKVREEPSFKGAINHINRIIRKYRPGKIDCELDAQARELISRNSS